MTKQTEISPLDSVQYTLQVDNQPSIRFTGCLVASTVSGAVHQNRFGRWMELYLYRTQAGMYICHKVGRTTKTGERDRFSGIPCTDPEAVIAFFGHMWLAKQLYLQANIEDVRIVA